MTQEDLNQIERLIRRVIREEMREDCPHCQGLGYHDRPQMARDDSGEWLDTGEMFRGECPDCEGRGKVN